MSTLTYWCRLRFGVDPVAMLSRPFDFNFLVMPPFYASLFKAWHFAGGFFSSSLVGYGSTDAFLVSSSTCKMVYSFLLECNYVVTHCVLCSASCIG